MRPAQGLKASAVSEPLLSVEHLVKNFPVRGGFLGREVATVHAVADVSFELGRGEFQARLAVSHQGLLWRALRSIRPD